MKNIFKYLLFFIIGFIIFILLNDKEKFSIGNQFTANIKDVLINIEFPDDLMECQSELIEDFGGDCVLMGILKFFNIIGVTEDDISEDYEAINHFLEDDTNEDTIRGILEHIAETDYMIEILEKHNLSEEIKVDIISNDTELLNKIESKKIYLVDIIINFTKNVGTEENPIYNLAHVFLLFREKTTFAGSDSDILHINDNCVKPYLINVLTNKDQILTKIINFWIENIIDIKVEKDEIKDFKIQIYNYIKKEPEDELDELDLDELDLDEI